MNDQMTIQAFSERTGISKSALRYYESKKLLLPNRNENNGYRYYTKDQIDLVKFIYSLRIAGIPIKEIQTYLSENEENQQNMLKNWSKLLTEKKHHLVMSLRYIESRKHGEQIYLLEKNEENIIWFTAISEPGKFGIHFKKRMNELAEQNITIKGAYLKYLSGVKEIKAQIGFGISDNVNTEVLTEIDHMEKMPACLCIALPYKSELPDIANAYRKLMNYVVEHDWVPAGSILEWYRGSHLEDIDIIIPVTYLHKGGNKI
ncbi:MerR family transcriptional regulator [Heyndrickxia sporothermodurans]